MKKSILKSRLIIQMFSSQHNKNQSYNQDIISNFVPMLFLSSKLKRKNFQIIKILFKLQTQVVYDLTDLLLLKTKQLNKYKHILDSKLTFYYYYQIV